MIPFLVAATLGLVLMVACVRYTPTILRWGLYALAVSAGLFLWLTVGHFVPLVGYLGYTFPFVGGVWIWHRRHVVGKKRAFSRAMRAEAEETDRRAIPKILSVEKVDD